MDPLGTLIIALGTLVVIDLAALRLGHPHGRDPASGPPARADPSPEFHTDVDRTPSSFRSDGHTEAAPTLSLGAASMCASRAGLCRLGDTAETICSVDTSSVVRRTCRKPMHLQGPAAYLPIIEVRSSGPQGNGDQSVMDSQQTERYVATDRPARRACLVDGCTCKDARIMSHRRAAFFAAWAKDHGETANWTVEPDPTWSFTFIPIAGRLTLLATGTTE